MKILSDYVAKMETEIQRELQSLGSGGAKTFDDYKQRCGRIAGIQFAVRELIEFVKSKPIEERDFD